MKVNGSKNACMTFSGRRQITIASECGSAVTSENKRKHLDTADLIKLASQGRDGLYRSGLSDTNPMIVTTMKVGQCEIEKS